MLCNSCLHYKSCAKHYTEEQLSMLNGSCNTFTDRSQWFHLPCKIGDELYFVANNTNACSDCDGYDQYDHYCLSTHTNYPFIANKPICNKQFMEISEKLADLITIAKNLKNIGKTVFLTREEAEKSIREIDKVMEINIPVEVNQTLYKVVKKGCYESNWKPYIQELRVTEISCKEIKGKISQGFIGKTLDRFHSVCTRYSFNSLGKNIFKTREEAQIYLDNIK